MKKAYIYISTIIIFVIIGSISSCVSNPCKDVVCSNNGTCREGACACPSGFEGNFCQFKAGDKFVGYWEGFKRTNGGVDVKITMIISPNTNTKGEIIPNEVIIYELSLSGDFIPIIAKCVLTDFTIPQQNAAGSSGYSYNGIGNVEKDKFIHILFHEKTDVGINNTIIFEGTKKIIP